MVSVPVLGTGWVHEGVIGGLIVDFLSFFDKILYELLFVNLCIFIYYMNVIFSLLAGTDEFLKNLLGTGFLFVFIKLNYQIIR